MSDAATAFEADAPPDRQVQILDELAEIGLGIARIIERRMQDARPAEPLANLQAAAMAFSRVSRAVRQTALLRARLIKDVDYQARDQANRAGFARENEEQRRKVRVERIVESLAEAGHGEDEDQIERILAETSERLDMEDYGQVLARPLSEIVADICRDLGLDPDWPRLAEEAWAREEIESGEVGWPLKGPVVRKLFPLPHRGVRESPDRPIELRVDPFQPRSASP